MKQRVALLIFIAIVYISGIFIIDNWKTTLYQSDSNGYYLHLVSFFINHDVGYYNITIPAVLAINPAMADPREDEVGGIRLTKIGKRYIKYTLGVSIMETPFFLAAHLYVKCTGAYKADGWSRPYVLAIAFSTIFYVLMGFYLLIKILEAHFSKIITAMVVLAIALATNLFYHSTYVTMAHGFLFFDYCLLLYLTDNFYRKPDYLNAIGIGATVGLIALTRVPEVISIVIPLLWGITDWESFKERLLFLRINAALSLSGLASLLTVFSIQIMYWYYVSGKLFFDPYAGEGFHFLHPKILNGWFHFNNGWLIYTPVMIFGLAGCFLLYRYYKAPLLPIFAFVGLHAYIHYSYYAWSYYPGLGSRPMVETYPLLSFGMAASFQYLTGRRWLSWLPATAIVFFSWLNLFQTWQMREGIIWSERGNAAFYYETFGTMTSSLNSLVAFDTRMLQPDTADLQYVNTLASEGFEDSSSFAVSSEFKHSGQYSLLELQQFSNWAMEVPLTGVDRKDFLYVELYGFMPGKDRIWSRDKCELMVIQLFDENNKMQREVDIKPSTQIGNNDYSIWNPGEADIWGKASFFIRLPRKMNQHWKAKAFIYNPRGQHLYVDDFCIKHYKRKK